MSRSVLLVDSDLDALGELASALRARGLHVSVADAWDSAQERTRDAQLDAVLIAAEMGAVSAEGQLAKLPRFVLTSDADSGDAHRLPRDADAIARRLLALPPRHAAVVSEKRDFRGDLREFSVIDLFQLLGMNRRTGVLTITTPRGTAEVRVEEGDLVDAAYRRLEAEKAVTRLLGEHDGSFAFTTAAPTGLRRIDKPLNALLMDGLRQLDEVKARRGDVADEHDALLAARESVATDGELTSRILDTLRAPRTIDELLDEMPQPDIDVVDTLLALLKDGAIRRIVRGAERVQFADPEHAAVLAAIVTRLSHPGFRGAARVILAGSSTTLTAASCALGRLTEATTPSESVPAAPVPHVLATLRVGDGAEIEVVGLPLLDAFAPLWSLSLAGSAVAVPLDAAERSALESACDAANVPVFDAARHGPIEAADPGQMASILRLSLDSVSGAK